MEKQRIFSNQNRLFIKRHIPHEFLETHDDKLRQLDINAFMKVYRTISEKAQKNTPLVDGTLLDLTI